MLTITPQMFSNSRAMDYREIGRRCTCGTKGAKEETKEPNGEANEAIEEETRKRAWGDARKWSKGSTSQGGRGKP